MIKKIVGDLRSSVVVFLVALPLCVGIALASQAPLSAGLIAGVIGGLVVGLLSGSELSVAGPTASLAIIVSQGIRELGDFKLFAVAVVLSGIVQMVFSMLRAGNIGNYFPTAVIKGMLSSIGLILILKQIPHALGSHADFMGSEEFHQHSNDENSFNAIFHAVGGINIGCVLLALISLVAILIWDRFSQKSTLKSLKFIPSALIAVALTAIINKFLFTSGAIQLPNHHLVQLPFVGGFESVISQISFPNWAALSKASTYSLAIMIASVGSIEALLSVDAADRLDPEKRTTSKNRELFVQGAGNILSGLAGGLPLTAVVLRSSANVNAGAKTRASAILHGAWLLLVIIAIPTLINLIPLPALAIVLILTGFKLNTPEIYRKMYRSGLDQFIPFAATILAVLLTDLLRGIAIGMLMGFIFIVKRGVHRSVVMVHDADKHYLIRFMKDISFFEKSKVMKMLGEIPNGAVVTIDGSKDVFVDADIVSIIEEFIQGAGYKDISVEVKRSTIALSPFFRIIHS